MHFKHKRFRQAVHAYSRALQQEPADAALYCNRAAARLQARARTPCRPPPSTPFQLCLELARCSHASTPSPRSTPGVAASPMQLGDAELEGALADALRAAELRPEWGKAHYRAAKTLAQMGRDDLGCEIQGGSRFLMIQIQIMHVF